MAVFNPIVITTAGISLLSQAMAGKGTLTFTSVATSTTVIPYNISNIQAMTALSGIMQTVVPVSAVLKTGNVQVSSIFSNSGVTNAYTANTIGLYAALGNGAQTLFAVAIATTPDNIPVQNDLSPSNFYYQFNIAISDTSQLTVTVPEDGSLPASVFNQMFPGIAAPGQNNDGDALVYNASSGAWGYVNTETVFTTVSGSGEFVSLQKTLADDFKQIQLFGKSVQKPTTGAQLFDINTAKNYEEAEITDYSSGTMEIDQNNSAITQSPKLKEWCPTMQAGQSYLLTCETTSTKKYITIGSSQWNFGGIFIPSADDLEENVEWHCTTQRSTAGDIVYYRDTFAGIMIVEGSTEKPYEVYTGGEAATEPTPDYPLPITSAGNYDAEAEKYEVGVSVTGKNLFDASKVTMGVSIDVSSGLTYASENSFATEHIPIFGMKEIYSNGKSNYNSSDNTLWGAFYDSDKKYLSGLTVANGKINVVSGAKYIRLGVLKEYINNLYISVQNEYSKFEGMQLTSLQLPNPLRGITVSSEEIYTDAEGQQWRCDYIDRERGKYVQILQSPNFVGSPNFAKSSSSVGEFVWRGAFDKASKSSGWKSISSFAKYSNSKKAGSFAVSGTSMFYTPKEEMTVAEVNELFQSMIDSRSVYIISNLLAPIETSLTQEQLSALNLSTYQGITNIGTDTMPQVEMAIESRGFNLASDLAQNLIDLQTTVQTQAGEIETLQNTVQSQSSAIAENTEKLNTLGLVGYGHKTASQSGESISLASLIPEWSDTFTSGALYSVYFSVSFSEYDSGDTTFQPYIMKSIRKGHQTTITQVELPTVYYQANSGNIIPYSCTFMIATNSDEDVSELEFHVDGNSHNFKDMTVAVYRIR